MILCLIAQQEDFMSEKTQKQSGQPKATAEQRRAKSMKMLNKYRRLAAEKLLAENDDMSDMILAVSAKYDSRLTGGEDE